VIIKQIVGVNSAASGAGASKRASNLDAQAAAKGRIVIGLFGTSTPETAKIFRDLCAGELSAVCKDVNYEAAI